MIVEEESGRDFPHELDEPPMTANADLEIQLAALRTDLGMLDSAWDDAKGELAPTDLVWLLFSLAEFAKAIKVIDDAVRAELVTRAESRKFETPYGPVEILRSTKRTKWRMDELVPALVSVLADDRTVIADADGEMRPWPVAAQELVRRVQAAVAFSYGRVTVLRALGFDPGEWCHEEPDGYSVKLPAVPA